MAAINVTDLSNAKLDVDHIADVANSLLPTATDRLGNVKATIKGAVDTIKAFNSRGAWTTATAYDVKDLVTSGGTWYVCVEAHTSSAAFATDSASKWRVHQGLTLADIPESGIVYITDAAFAGGAKGDGSDDTVAIVAAFNAVQSGQVLDLCGLSCALFNSVAGVTSGDAASLGAVPRLFGKSNIIVRNGTLYAKDPAASETKYRYPTTLTIDGCTNIFFQGVTLKSKGESYGDSDASEALGFEARRAFLAQNGGHACAVIRSSKIYFDDSCHFERCGSVGPMYVSSSDEVVCNGSYATAESLGYAAFAIDSWCGGSAVSGFDRHRTYLNNCRSDDNGATYGSKGCVVTEDRDVYVYVTGGVWKDAYANGSANMIGMAFQSNASHLYVDGGLVENCACLGMTSNSVGDDTILEVSNVVGRNIRTSMHIFDSTSYGAHKVKYRGCDVEISGTALWGAAELSRSSVIANLKQASIAEIDIADCRTSGASTFAINMTACYGGVRVIGGDRTVTNRLFDSAGWGGSAAGTRRGYELLGAAVVRVLLVDPMTPGNALTQATTAVNAIKNQDTSLVFTYQLIDFDKSVSIESNAMRDFVALITAGSGLQERKVLAQSLVGCYQSLSPGQGRATAVKVISLDGIAGSFAKVTFAILDNKTGDAMTLVDDLYANRRSQGNYAGPTVVGTELHYGVFLNTATASLTVGGFYPVTFAN